MTQRVGGPKKIGMGDITGALGVNIIERRLLEMGYLWYASGGVEAGIDGRLEIRAESGEVTNLYAARNLLWSPKRLYQVSQGSVRSQ